MPIVVSLTPDSPNFEFDPVSEDAANENLPISQNNYAVWAFSAPMPQPDVLYASSVDTEGENPASVRFRNRVIGLTVHVTGAQALYDLEEKIAKLIREKGTLKYTTKGGVVIVFDVLAVDSLEFPYDDTLLLEDVAVVSMSLTCKPLGRGPEVDLGDNVETTLPWLIFTEAAIPGSWPALARLVIDNDVAVDQAWVIWGIQSRYYSSASTAALAYQAEDLTALSGSSTGALSGASGTGTMRNLALNTFWEAMLSTQATGGGAHLTHIGTFRVLARVQVPSTNTGTVSVALEWGEGDFRRFSRNTARSIDPAYEGGWTIVDLGMVTLSKVLTGSQRWEGRLLAKSTVTGDDVYIDWLVLVPADEGSGEVARSSQIPTSTSLSFLDSFTSTTSGSNLNARVAPTGGTWATSGATTDFQFADSGSLEYISRGTTSDTGAGRFAILGTTNYTDTVVTARIYPGVPIGSGGEQGGGVIARWVDSNNYLAFTFFQSSVIAGGTNRVAIIQKVAGTTTVLTSASASVYNGPGEAHLFTLTVIGSRVSATMTEEDFGTSQTLTAVSTDLASGGALDDGKPGLQHVNTTASIASPWLFDDFSGYTLPADAAIFASQSLELRHNAVIREDSTGSYWQPPSQYTGDYLLVPPAGAEGRTSRVIVKPSRGGPGGLDSSIDDVSARLFVTPRYLTVPEP